MPPIKHHHLGPSKFPAWKLCPCFESDPTPREDATEGTRQHAALESVLRGGPDPLAELSPDGAEAVQWAADYIRSLAGELPIQPETKLQYSTPDAFAEGGESVLFYGTADALIIRGTGDHADLIDYKSGADDHDHRPQLAGYALALFSMRKRLKAVRCHVLYGRVQHVDAWSLTQADAAAQVLPVIERHQDPDRQPAACAYCTMCAASATCPALLASAGTVASSQEMDAGILSVLMEPGALIDPATASKALTLARQVSTWADAVRKAVTDLAKEGARIPGYRIQERKGSPDLIDPTEAAERLNLPALVFFKAGKWSIPKLSDLYAEANGIPKSRARSEVEDMLSDIMKPGSPSVSLVVDKAGG
jgi:hypothetical protein